MIYLILCIFCTFTFGSCKLEGEITVTVTEENEKLVYLCTNCWQRFCFTENLLDISSFDPETYQSDSKVSCPFCKSEDVTIIGEIGPDGELIEYEY